MNIKDIQKLIKIIIFQEILFSVILRKSQIHRFQQKKKYNKILERHYNFYSIYEILLFTGSLLKETIKICDVLYHFIVNTNIKNDKIELEKFITKCKTFSIMTKQDFANTLVNYEKEIINSSLLHHQQVNE